MKFRLKSLVVLLFMLILLSCGNEKEVDKQIKSEIYLNNIVQIDNNLSISFQIPNKWNEMPTSLSEKLVARISKNGEDDFIVYAPKSFFYNSETNSLLRVGSIKFQNNVSSDSLTIENYISIFRKFNSGLVVDATEIENSLFPIKQIKIAKNNLLSFKFLFQNKKSEIIQFDFSIKEEEYSEIYPTIIASIKSIKLM